VSEQLGRYIAVPAKVRAATSAVNNCFFIFLVLCGV
jgi:hypothetical protein